MKLLKNSPPTPKHTALHELSCTEERHLWIAFGALWGVLWASNKPCSCGIHRNPVFLFRDLTHQEIGTLNIAQYCAA